MAPAWLKPASVRVTLVVLNLLMGVQTALAAGYLWGGVELPAGITHAEYARRGAYPLVATALPTGLLALVSRPSAAGRPGLRLLLGLWLAQNLVLVLSSLLRPDLYVEAWGLTRLRLAAGVWMGLVAGGLALTAWQVARDRSNGWLLVRVALMAGVVLYGLCFVSLGGIVARMNVDRFERTGALDGAYLCDLGPAALAALAAHAARTGDRLCRPAQIAPRQAEDWRDCGFRMWRLGRYAEARNAGGGS